MLDSASNNPQPRLRSGKCFPHYAGGRYSGFTKHFYHISSLVARKRKEQPSGSLGIEEEFLILDREFHYEFQPSFDEFAVCSITSGSLPLPIHLSGIRVKRKSVKVEIYPHTASSGHFQCMPRKAETGDVGAGMDVKIKSHLNGGSVERRHL